MHVMIDIETLGLNVDAKIIQICAVSFEENGHKNRAWCNSIKSEPEDQSNRSTTPATVEFWKRQPEATQKTVFYGPVLTSLEGGLTDLGKWFQTFNKIDGVWANGITFDISILEHAFNQHDIKIPWHYNQVFDLRTLHKMFPTVSRVKSLIPHDGLSDCVAQIETLASIFNLIKQTNEHHSNK